MESYKRMFNSLAKRKKPFSSIDREQLRRIKYETTPEQRMNWLEDAVEFARECRKFHAAKNKNAK